MKFRKARSPQHPDSWIFGPKRSIRRDVAERVAEHRPPVLRKLVIAVAVVAVAAGSAISPLSPISPLNTSSSGNADVPGAGVPGGTVLTPSGSLRVTEKGAVIDALDVRGRIYVVADGVTIRRTRVRSGSWHAIRLAQGNTGLTVEDSTLECTSRRRGRAGVAFGSYVATRLEVGGHCRRGFLHDDRTTITDSYWRGEPFPDVVPTASTSPPSTSAPTTTAPAPPPTTAPPPPPAAPAPTTPPPPLPGYRLDFADEFDGSALDTSVWATAPFGGSLPATVGGGLMTLKTTAANQHFWGQLASTGPRRADVEPSYPTPKAWQEGYFEARLRYTNNPWSWPAFWLFSQAKSEAWPGEDCARLTSEWDIMENGVENGPGQRPAGSWYFTALHRNTTDHTPDGWCGQRDEERRFSREYPGVDLSAWHTWGARWTADELCTYLDGVQIQCTPTYDSTAQPMHLTFTMQYLSRCDGCPSRPPSLDLQVDWVRVWQQQP